MPSLKRLFITVFCLTAISVAAQRNDAETFDLSGLPAQPATFLQQQLRDLIKSHKAGDMIDAAEVQRKLAQCYREVNDETRAKQADERARLADELASGSKSSGSDAGSKAESRQAPGRSGSTQSKSAPPGPAPSTSTVPKTGPAPAPAAIGSKRPAFSGNYYRMPGPGVLEKWDFNEDGTFYHTGIAGGSGTSVRNGARGTFEVVGNELVLTITSEAGGFATPTGSRQTTIGGGAETKHETQRMKITLVGERGKNGIVLDGVEFKVRSWQ